MGADSTPPLALLIGGPILIVLILPLIPIAWILVILHGVKVIIFRELGVKDAITETTQTLGFTITVPIMALFYLVFCLVIKIVTPIHEIILNMRRKRPRPSITRRWEHEWNAQNGTGGAEFIPIFQKPYQYRALDAEHEIRLLIIYPGSFKEPLLGDIVTTNLLWRPAYDALSYTWADEAGDMKQSSTIRHVNDGSTIHITKNCEAAIRRLRLRHKKRRIWVDAVCINQVSDTERNQQVSLMSRIFVTARHVIVYTGEGTAKTNLLFDWLNDLDEDDLNCPSIGKFEDINEGGLGILTRVARIWNGLGDTKVLINEIATKWVRFWSTARARCFSPLRKSESSQKAVLLESELTELVRDYCSRRWFKRVWVLQEVALPDLHKTTVLCGVKTTTGKRALHLLSFLKDQGPESMMRIFALVRQRIDGLERSHLLDILIETRDRDCRDPRDKIFGVLSIARGMDKGRFPELKANYEQAAPMVYACFSAFFICHHGPGFFLSLIKCQPKLDELPSWAADWTVPWPNYRAVRGRDFAARFRSAKINDAGAEFERENGREILKLHRPRILQGHFTRDGHVDDSNNTHIEDVQHLSEGEVLVEMYPGLAALLREEGEYYVFIQVCPHALSEHGVEKLVEMWSRVVVDGEGPEEQMGQGAGALEYLSSAEIFNIH